MSGRRRGLLGGLLAVGFVLAILRAGPAVHAQLPPPAAEHVVVQVAGGERAQAGGSAPSLFDQGFRTLDVPAGVSRDDFLAQLRATPGILSAEPDAPVYAAAVPDDPYYPGNQKSYFDQVNAPAAWDLATGTGTIVVAVLDSGSDLTHPEFSGRLWENPGDANSNGIDDDGNGCVDDRYGCREIDLTKDNGCGYTSSQRNGNVVDDHGRPGSASHSHGTLVAGVVGAAGNNGAGITGVGWNVRIMTVKVLDCGVGPDGPTGSISQIADGIDYARRMGANIINLSLASKAGDQSADQPKLRTAIQDAQAQGIILVAAAGNHAAGDSQVGPGYPAAYTQFSNVVAVGSALSDNHWDPLSNYGPAIDFAAPGRDIAGTSRTDLDPGSPYRVGSGTSFAAPLVSGMFALMEGRNPRLLADDYIQLARDAATPAPAAAHGQNWAGSGVINIGAAVGRVPMTLSGGALRDWMDVPAGTELRAVVGTTDCGGTVTTSFGPLSRYNLRVPSEVEKSGCGAPGRMVELILGGQPAVPTFLWGGLNQDLGLASRDVTTVSPPPGPIVIQTTGGDWSNIAQLDASGPLPGALTGFSSPWSEVLRWDPLKPFLDQDLGAWRRWIQTASYWLRTLMSST